MTCGFHSLLLTAELNATSQERPTKPAAGDGNRWHSWGVGRDTYYDILGVRPAATPDEIKVRYRDLIRRIHPDFDGPPALFRQVQEAYEVLSDPVRRASYDRLFESRSGATPTRLDPKARWYRQPSSDPSPRGGDSVPSTRQWDTNRSVPRRKPPGTLVVISWLNSHPAGLVAMAGAVLLALGAALARVGTALALLGAAAFILAGVAGLGGRGAKERQAYQRSGMTAVDAMTGRQFEVLLENFFANKGYRVARIGGRGNFGADLLLNDAHGRMIVQARRWNGVVPHDAVQQAIDAMVRYRAPRALVVTSSDYSQQAVTAANSNGVKLWNRATLAAELTVFRVKPLQSGVRRFSLELQAGSRICLGFLAAFFVAFVAVSTRARRQPPDERRRG